MQPVRVRHDTLVLPTYLPAAPDRNPMFLEKRVYQGSSGRVYPLPFTDRIAEKPVERAWRAVWIENEFLRVLILPELGGRIHRIVDRTNGYDLIYHQPVIKPALVGLAGPWISGGIEFNWPQHHRPATFLPVDVQIERRADGSATVWCGDHDPLCRLKGMHGVCLRPDRACLELRVRAYNRTPQVQTFLWWANVATRVHEAYQSFFPSDVSYVADHARRSMSAYPLAQGHYYGVNYGERRRQGVPRAEWPRQFVPPYCQPGISSRESPIPSYPPNDLSFYANIPVPTSYMCMGSRGDFFGGYDYRAQAGIVHVASHHIAPGKKQWTWGNHEFGYAWDRNLTEPDAQGEYGPYIELMAGVYTDNQPDFSFLQPGETKTWSQYWYPLQKIGPAQHANREAAVSFRLVDCDGQLRTQLLSRTPAPQGAGGKRLQALAIGICVTRNFPDALIEVLRRGQRCFTRRSRLEPGQPFLTEIPLPPRTAATDLRLRVVASSGEEIIAYQPAPRVSREVPPPASEPPAPADIPGADELFITGLHLEQYRHATRCPTLYWREALRRDPLDTRCNNALGLWHLKRGEWPQAENHFRNAIARLTRRNANPYDGEAYYNLGLCLRYQAEAMANPEVRRLTAQDCHTADGDVQTSGQFNLPPGFGARATALLSAAYDAFYKACWNQSWMAAGYHALAEIDCCRADWSTALEHLNRSLRLDTDNLRARNLKVIVLKQLAATGQTAGQSPARVKQLERTASVLLRETLALDPLDWWARHLRGDDLACDWQTRLDLAHDYARAGLLAEAIAVLDPGAQTSVCPSFPNRNSQRNANPTLPDQSWGALPLVHYTLGWLEQRRGNRTAARRHFTHAAQSAPDYCFPSRLEDIAVLEAARHANPRDPRAPYYLGNLLYDRRRHSEAIRLWEESARLDPGFPTVWRNLGIGYFNIDRRPVRARRAYDRAFHANPDDARILHERDQLWKRLGQSPARRLRALEQHRDLVDRRDDLSVELCALYNQTGEPRKALERVGSRHFQPWEGGEGGPLGQWVRSHVALGRALLRQATARDFPTHNRKTAAPRLAQDAHQRGDWLRQSVEHFQEALTAPLNLGEAKHLLANQSDIHYWLGCALEALGDVREARRHWHAAATFKGDFQEMSVRAFSEMTYYSALAWERLGKPTRARALLRELLAYARRLQKAEAKIDYFATSLPTMLLFEDDLAFRQRTTALFLEAQAHLGLGQGAQARALLRVVLRRDPNHALASDLLGG
jgi:tetratricopeptide (TPR) repeat protein